MPANRTAASWAARMASCLALMPPLAARAYISLMPSISCSPAAVLVPAGTVVPPVVMGGGAGGPPGGAWFPGGAGAGGACAPPGTVPFPPPGGAFAGGPPVAAPASAWVHGLNRRRGGALSAIAVVPGAAAVPFARSWRRCSIQSVARTVSHARRTSARAWVRIWLFPGCVIAATVLRPARRRVAAAGERREAAAFPRRTGVRPLAPGPNAAMAIRRSTARQAITRTQNRKIWPTACRRTLNVSLPATTRRCPRSAARGQR